MILAALDSAGGQQYLVQQATKNPSAFLQLIGKVLPSEIKAEHTGPKGGAIQFSDLERANRLRYLIEQAMKLKQERDKNMNS